LRDQSDIEILAHLTASGIRYALLHEPVETKPVRSDVDLVVAPEHFAQCVLSLKGFSGFGLVQVLRYEATGYALVLARCRPDWESVTIDVTLDYRWSGRVFLSNHFLLDKRWLDGQVWRVDPMVELSFLWLKKVYEKGAIPRHQRERIQALSELPAARDCYRRLFGAVLGDKVHDLVRSRDWDHIVSSIPRLAAAQRASAGGPVAAFRYWKDELARRLSRLRRPTGLLIALMGPDGAGKSTLASAIASTISGPFRRSDVFHFRPRVVAPRQLKTSANPPRLSSRGPIASALKLVLYLADYWIGYLAIVRPALCRTSLVMFDRYFDDLGIDSRRYGYTGPRWLVALASRAVPRPDLTLVLTADAQQLSERKGEISIREGEVLLEAYRQYATQRGVVQITSQESLQHTLRLAGQEIHLTLARRAQLCSILNLRS
jgi:thymidylate kinase